MNYDELIHNMTPAVHAALKRAIELGKWPNGVRLTPEQQAICMRAVIAYDQANLPPQEQVGYIDRTRPDGSLHGKDPLTADVLKIINPS